MDKEALHYTVQTTAHGKMLPLIHNLIITVTNLVWFRNDLRILDNPALHKASQSDQPLIALFIHDSDKADDWRPGAASNWWLHHSLESLNKDLAAIGMALTLRQGEVTEVFADLLKQYKIKQVFWNRRYEPESIKKDKSTKQWLEEQGISVHSSNASLINEPWKNMKADGTPYKVFTSYWKSAQKNHTPSLPICAPEKLAQIGTIKSKSIEDLQLIPDHAWPQKLTKHWCPGETGAHNQLENFIATRANDYAEGRNIPGQSLTSKLSAHLHFGEISPRQILHALCNTPPFGMNTEQHHHFIREIYWREFSYHLLYHFPHTVDKPLDPRFEHFRWKTDQPETLRKWQRGQTGIPLVDAGMKQLWETGWMHNRVRMIAASFLVKNLLIPWQQGAQWFWDTLVDADLANNTMGWQWVAGCGADAAPYFRIFNPVLQGEKFDPNGDYVKRWLPQLEDLPKKYIHQPWTAPEEVLSEAGVTLGKDYPSPIVDLKQSRTRALEHFAKIKTVKT